MATSLQMSFGGAGGKKLSLTFPYANPSAGAAAVKNLMEGIVANGEIYTETPLSLLEAQFIQREATTIPLN